jgi:hypothetical protein
MTFSMHVKDESAPPPRDVVFELSCDGENHGLFPSAAVFSGLDYVEFRKKARENGWKFTERGAILGPCCRG